MKNNPLYSQQVEFCWPINNLSEVELVGSDSKNFLNGQITANLDSLLPDSFISFSRLDPKGRIKFSGYVLLRNEAFSLIVDSREKDKVLNDLSMYIISEDVELIERDVNNAHFSSKIIKGSQNFPGLMNYVPGFLVLNSEIKLNSLNEENFLLYNRMLSSDTGIFSESVLSLHSNHLDKGCFVGQEVISKIEKNRGARLYPLLLQVTNPGELHIESMEMITCDGKEFGKVLSQLRINNKLFLIVKAKREFHVDKCNIRFEVKSNFFNADIFLIKDFFKRFYSSISEDFFIKGVDFLNGGSDLEAEKYFSLSLLLNPNNIDTLESIGVLFGRQKLFRLAHKMMDRLLELNSQSIMAHTNKSLFFMNEGLIEEAEKEKDLALKLSLEGSEANSVNDEKRILREKTEKLNKQLEMYKEVLEIDPDDEFAIGKWLEINFELHRYLEIKDYLSKKEYKSSPKYFIWMHKASLALGEDLGGSNDDILKILNNALKIGDQKSADYLRKLISEE